MEYMSQEGYDKIVAELRQLELEELPQVRDAIAEARDKGDLSENFEYHAAKREQGRIMGRIRLAQSPRPEWPLVALRSASPAIAKSFFVRRGRRTKPIFARAALNAGVVWKRVPTRRFAWRKGQRAPKPEPP